MCAMHARRNQKTISMSLFSPFSLWFLGIILRLSGLAAKVSLPSEPSFWLSL